MRTRPQPHDIIAATLAAIALITGILHANPEHHATPATTPAAATAPTHNQTNHSLWYCSWARQYAADEVAHSVADYLTTDAVRFYCQARHNGTSYQYWVWTGIPIGAYGYIMGSGYQYCDLVNCIEP